MKPGGKGRLVLWGSLLLAGLGSFVYLTADPADSSESRKELQNRFGAKADALHDAYYYVPWNFVGRAPQYLRFRYENEEALLSMVDLPRSGFRRADRLPGFTRAPSWWNAKSPLICSVRDQDPSARKDGGTPAVPLTSQGLCP